MIQKVSWVICTLVVFFSTACIKETPEKPDEITVPETRTVLCYLESNDGVVSGTMDYPLKNNIVWMYQKFATMEHPATWIVFFRPKFDDTTLPRPQIWKFKTDGKGNVNGQPALSLSQQTYSKILAQGTVVKTYDSKINANDPAVMRDVLKTMNSEAPTQEKVLIFGSHATGWINDHDTIAETRSMGNDKAVSINLGTFARVVDDCFDEGELECLMLDACMMGTVEVAYEFRNIAKHMVFSVMETPLLGYPYNRFFPTFYEDKIDYNLICNSFYNYYLSGNWGTTTAIDCSQMDELTAVMREELLHLRSGVSYLNVDGVQQYGRNTGSNYWKYFSFDIADVFAQLNGGIVPASISEQLSKTIVAKYALDSSGFLKSQNGIVSKYCGLGMYLPGTMNFSSYNTYYKTLSWYKAVGWNEIYPD